MIMFVELKSKLGQMYAFYRRKRPCGKRPRRRLIDIYPIPGDRSYKTTPQERSDYSKDQYKIGRNLHTLKSHHRDPAEEGNCRK